MTALCFHCREPLAGSKLAAQLGERREPVCCAGCQAVAEMIAGAGLDDFYRRRTTSSTRPTRETWRDYLKPAIANEFIRRGTATDSIDLIIENLRCSACGWLIERTVGALEGVASVEVNAVLGRAHVTWRNDVSRLEAVMQTIANLGYGPHPLTAATTMRVHCAERNALLKRFVVASFGMMQVMMFAVAGYSADLNGERIDPTLAHYFRLVSLLVSLPVLLYAARPFLANAWNNLRTRTVGMDLPVSAALSLAFAASTWNTFLDRGEVYFDSITMFVFFLTLSRLIEHGVRHRTNSVSDALARHLPATAQRAAGNRVETIPAAALRRGDVVIVATGATVPVDGTITDGATTLDESLLTGESLPTLRRIGDTVAGGSINTGAPIRVEVAAVGDATLLSGIVALLRRAQVRKPTSILAADRAAGTFLRIVLLASVIVCAAWLYVDPSRAFPATLAVLVVACPCAFSIAAPAALSASAAQLARDGVLVTNPDAIETLAEIQHVVFDKTGTLTRGAMRLDACLAAGRRSMEECMAIAAALERASNHPIAAAFKDVDTHGLVASDVDTVPGFGVEGTVSGRRYRIGLSAFVAALRGADPDRTGSVTGTVVVLGDDTEMLATFELSDELRTDAGEAVHRLKTLGVSTEILSGDAHGAVAAIAKRCNVSEFFARRTPAQKLARIELLQAQGTRVAMIGDGINDAPVLGAANVSMAMGHGAALALASADFVLVAERPAAIAATIAVARRTSRIARQNLFWSGAYNLCALPLAAFGLIPPWAAALGMSASSLLVLLNSLRLLPRERDSGGRSFVDASALTAPGAA